MTFSPTDAAAGLGTGLALIAAIGTQNAMLLRQGIRRDHVLLMVLICAVSDIILITAGVAGMGALVQAAPQLITAVTWVGALFLFCYGLMSLGKGIFGPPERLDATTGEAVIEGHDAAPPEEKRRLFRISRLSGMSRTSKLALTMLALTWLNPHVYLDALVFLGSAAAAHGEGRWSFGLGAILASILWFTVVGFGARYLAPLFAKPVTWRVLDIGVGVLMIVLGIKLVLG